MRSRSRIIPIAAVLISVTACSSSDESSNTTQATASTTAASATTATPTTEAPAASVATTAPASTVPATAAPATTTPAGTTPPTTDPSVGDPDLVALAESALIDLSVFPEGWTETPVVDETDDADPENEQFEQRVDDCLGIDSDNDESDLLEAREARSGEFTDETDETQPSVEHLVTVADDEAMAIRAMERAGTEGAAACLQETLQAFFDADPDFQADETGIDVGDLVVTRLDVDGDPTLRVGYRIEIPLIVEDQTFVQYLEVVYQRQGRALSQLQLASFSVPFSEEGFVSLTDDVVIRLATIGG